ncbi:MAG: PDZ domain-containing protein, partial [Bryobacterales bacterium]|nr:PDZ domain-containing protein [Bryobacterales bacterium]
MKKLTAIFLLGVLAAAAQGLTPAQKESDFRYLASLYAGLYGPREWKKQAINFDLLAITPWLQKVAATETDIEFYEVCQDYIASLQDTHVTFSLPSSFIARLPFGVDLYDDQPLIDTIDRTRLPQARFPFVIGDELVSIDGEDTTQLIEKLRKGYPQANVRSSRRGAAGYLTVRAQSRVPSAASLGDEATVVIRRQNGDQETYIIPWIKTGTPLEVGPVPSPRTRAAASQSDLPTQLQDLRVNIVPDALLGYGSRNPIFVNGLPSTFTRRLGGAAADIYYSGVFRYDDLRIGFLRIPSYAPANQTLALQQFDAEMAFFRANTDGLIIDEMRNPGGNACYLEQLVSRLTTEPFRTLGWA